MHHRTCSSGWWRCASTWACSLTLMACGDGVGRPIVGVETNEEPTADAGLKGGGGDDSGFGDAGQGGNGSEAYCAAVEAWPGTEADTETQIVTLLNSARVLGFNCAGTELGERLPELVHEPALRCAARVHTRDMIERDYFDHVSPEGEGPRDRIERAGYPLGVWAEVIGSPDANSSLDALQGVLSEQSEDCTNLLSPSFDAVGVGYYGGFWTIVMAGPLQLSP